MKSKPNESYLIRLFIYKYSQRAKTPSQVDAVP